MPEIFLIAGEVSGDLHGEALMRALKQQNPSFRFSGVAGPKMRTLGIETILPMEVFQAMGFLDIIFSIPRLLRQFRQIKKSILSRSPEAVVFIDYPGFNLRMASKLRKAGYKGKLIQYICPKVWAWNKKRIGSMALDLDLLLCILPFEPPLFYQTKLSAIYVGNPLIERLEEHIYGPIAVPDHVKLIALFPGSRTKEIDRNLPYQLKAAKAIQEKHPATHFAISIAHPRFRAKIEKQIKNEEFQNIHLLDVAQNYDLMKRADYAIAKSGTVILELALHNVPTIVTYGVSKIDLFIVQKIIKVNLPFYTLPNLITQKEIFPELIGPKLTQEALNGWMSRLLDDPFAAERMRAGCEELHKILGSASASYEAATATEKIIKKPSSPL